MFFPALSGCLGDGEAASVCRWALHAGSARHEEHGCTFTAHGRVMCWLVSSEGDQMPCPNQGAGANVTSERYFSEIDEPFSV